MSFDNKGLDTLFSAVSGMMIYPSLRLAVELDIAGLLKDTPQSIERLAQQTGSHTDSLYRVLRMLAAVNIFDEIEPRVFKNNAASKLLLKGVSNSMHDYMAIDLHPERLRIAMDALSQAVRTGQPAFECAHGINYWQYLEQNTEIRKSFDKDMEVIAGTFSDQILSEYDFSNFKQVADIGGGHGSLLISLLQTHPHLNGILFDLPEVITQVSLINSPVMARCQLQQGDFFLSIPQHCDVYLMRHILHNWADEACIQILQNCRTASPNAKILVIEHVILPEQTNYYTLTMDFWMLLLFSEAKERSVEEYKTLFQQAGYQLNRIIETNSPVSILELLPNDLEG
ncbi:methyltransferase [Candidatus Albibeggiatoa sp. nov. NOAA]|uniref:methyltransferase n=1 Tax=Candidatus Albibeggiatoa sp. nov. NOAA TaxID=3162724 RepID=UPI003302929B|nr:methyltransferase [Thiotrichaceae bacterium]